MYSVFFAEVICISFPMFWVGRDTLRYINGLRHKITDSNYDDDNILRKISNMPVRTNILIFKALSFSQDCAFSGVLLAYV
jgi:hypothetical protein